MKFQTLKKSHKKQIVIGALAICIIGGTLTFATTKAKYKLTESIDLVKGTINYKPYDFKIMAMYKSDDGTNYTEITDRMPSSGYVINESKSYCTLDNKSHDTEVVLKTINGHHVIENLKKSDKCYLYFDKEPSGSEAILAEITVKTSTPNFGQLATTDEGVYKVADGMYGGYSYYWRGAVTNNYVKFANFCWRIIRINGDGTLRLIYDGTICHANGTNDANSIAVTSQKYNPTYNASYYVGWTYSTGSQRPSNLITSAASNAKIQTDSWYSTNITGTNATKVALGKYCNDRNVDAAPSIWGSGYVTTWSATGIKFAYAGAKRLYETYVPTLSCPSGDVYTLSVGLITADEVELAGGKNENNRSYYLYNGQDYWTMSPSSWDGNPAWVFCVSSNGYLAIDTVYSTYGVRPVINLRSDITFSSGDGTLNNPYVVN